MASAANPVQPGIEIRNITHYTHIIPKIKQGEILKPTLNDRDTILGILNENDNNKIMVYCNTGYNSLCENLKDNNIGIIDKLLLKDPKNNNRIFYESNLNTINARNKFLADIWNKGVNHIYMLFAMNNASKSINRKNKANQNKVNERKVNDNTLEYDDYSEDNFIINEINKNQNEEIILKQEMHLEFNTKIASNNNLGAGLFN